MSSPLPATNNDKAPNSDQQAETLADRPSPPTTTNSENALDSGRQADPSTDGPSPPTATNNEFAPDSDQQTDPSTDRPSASLGYALCLHVQSITSDHEERIQLLVYLHQQAELSNADRQYTQQYIRMLVRSSGARASRRETQRRRIGEVRGQLRAIRSALEGAGVWEILAHADHSRAFQPIPLMLQNVGEHIERAQIQLAEIRLAIATLPVIYGDPYDKLVGHGSTDLNQVHSRNRAFVRERQARALAGLDTMTTNMEMTALIRQHSRNRALVQNRQARALAGLDTSAMDEEIAALIRQHPREWGDIGHLVRSMFRAA